MALSPVLDTISHLMEQGSAYTWAGIAFVIAMLFKQLRKKLDSLLSKLLSALLDNIADYARQSVLLRRSDRLFQRRYHKHLRYEHRVFNVRGLRTIGAVTLDLEKIFVELRIASSSSPQQANHDLLAREELQGNQPIWVFLRLGDWRDFFRFNACSIRQILRNGHVRDMFNLARRRHQKLHLAVIGAPGCGKTTLMQHIALVLAAGRQCEYGLEPYTPLLLFLRQHVKILTAEKPPTLADLAQQHFADSDNYPKLKPPPGWFARQLDQGRCLVMLDGLDEVADKKQRRQVSAWVDKQIVTYPDCHFILTSRPQGYKDAPLQQTHVLEVQPFSMIQVRRFVDSWYLATEAVSSGRLDEGVENLARNNAKDLLKRLHEHPRLSVLTVNPLLLTMIAMVHRYRGQLPGRRVELYAEICDVLLGHWQASKGMQLRLTPAQNRAVLEPLAAHMMTKALREISTADSAALLTAPLREVGVMAEDAAALRRYLQEVQSGSGLLLEGEVDVWRFAHLTFQEYLCAAHLSKQPAPHGNWWRARVADSWWQETLRLYAAQGDAAPLVKVCLGEGSVTALSLAADCMEEALKLDADTRQRVEDILIAGLEAGDPERRKLAAQVRLRRRLNSLQRIDEKHEIDLEYLTCAEYQLFLDDMRAQGKYYQPDHWEEYVFPAGMAAEPVRGMRAEDAADFCDWLSAQGHGFFRLPTPEEVNIHPSHNYPSYFGAWCDGYDDFTWAGREEEVRRLLAALPVIEEGLALPQQLDLRFNRAFDRADARPRARDLRALSHALGPILITGSFARTFPLAFTNNHTFLHALNLAHFPDLARDLDLTHLPGFARDLARDLARNLPTLADTIVSAIDNQQSDSAYQYALQFKQYATTTGGQRLGLLLCDLLTIAQATSQVRLVQTWQKYVVDLSALLWYGLQKLDSNSHSWQDRLLRRQSKYAEEKQAVMELHWYLRIIQARTEGKLPAWEGIRIVRDNTLNLQD